MGEGLRSLVETLAAMRRDLRRLTLALGRGPERAWSAEDLLTHGEALRRLRAGKDNREARALLDLTERRHAPGDARWRWGDVLDATREAVVDPVA